MLRNTLLCSFSVDVRVSQMLSSISRKYLTCFVEHEVCGCSCTIFSVCSEMLSLLVASLRKHRDYSLHDLTAICNEKIINTHPLFSLTL